MKKNVIMIHLNGLDRLNSITVAGIAPIVVESPKAAQALGG